MSGEDIKPGYKRTEVGIIPAEWCNQPLENGIKLLSGHHVLAKHCNTHGYGTPYITGPADFPNGFIESTKYTEKPTTVCQKNDILLTVKGSGTGSTVIAENEYCISRQLMAIRVTEWDSVYVHEFLKINISNFESAATGLIPGLSRSDILKKQILVPPFPEQRAIATALSDVDAVLAKIDHLIAKKRDLKQATMQQLLTGKTRLPGFSGEWEVKRLGDIAVLNRHNLLPASQPDHHFVHFSLPAFDDGKCAPVELGSAIGSNKFQVPPDAVLVSKLNPRIPRIWAPETIPSNSCASTEWLVLTPKEGCSRSFLFVLCSSPYFCEQMELQATGTTGSHQRISPSTALRLEVSVPVDKEEQTAIATALAVMDAELAALETRRDKTRALKKGMMQELLTGRIRLVESI